MATTFQSYSAPSRTIEVKTGSDGDDATIQSTDGLIVLNANGGTFSLPTPPTLAQITQARLSVQSIQKVAPSPAPSLTPNDGATLDFLSVDGAGYTVVFPDGNVLTFSGTVGEMATIVQFQGVYSLKSASNPNTTFVQGVQIATPPTFGGNTSQNI